MASDKIFVDLDEEIVFTVEKILESSAKRVIVVIPESANLVASLVSLKLLSRQIAKSDKTIVIVTEDSLGLRLAKEAGLVAKHKISEIGPEVWAKAEELKEKFLAGREKIKKELIKERTEQEGTGEDYVIVEEEKDENNLQETEEQTEQDKDKELEDKLQNIGFKPLITEKPRLEPKIVKLGNILVLAGGDIEKEKKYEKEIRLSMSPHKQEPSSVEHKPKVIETKENSADSLDVVSENEPNKAVHKSVGQTSIQAPSIVGKDISSMFTSSSRQREKVSRQGPSGKNRLHDITNSFKNFYDSGNKKIKIIISVLVGIFLIYVLSSLMSSARVDIYLQEMDISIKETVTGDLNASSVDTEKLTVPVKQVKIPAESSSNNADTTGTTESGEKARGLVTFYNKTEQEINLNTGTVLENINSGLKYKLLETVTVPAAVVDGGGNVNVGVRKDVSMEAESFGEKYNVSGSATYKVSGFTTDQLSAKSFTTVSGGTTVKENAVSQEDIDNLKNGLVEELKNTLSRDLEQLVSDDEVILDGSLKFNEPTVSSDKKVGEKADIVNVSVSLDATAYVIQKDDLKELVVSLIEKNSDFDVKVNKDEIKDPDISDVKIDSDKITFTISSSGNVIAGFDEKDIKQNISGKSISDADEYLASLNGIDRYKLKVSPFFIPSFLKKLPKEDKITVYIHQ